MHWKGLRGARGWRSFCSGKKRLASPRSENPWVSGSSSSCSGPGFSLRGARSGALLNHGSGSPHCCELAGTSPTLWASPREPGPVNRMTREQDSDTTQQHMALPGWERQQPPPSPPRALGPLFSAGAGCSLWGEGGRGFVLKLFSRGEKKSILCCFALTCLAGCDALID